MSAPAAAAGAVEGLRARVERRASRGVWFGYRTGQGYALKVEAPIQRRRAHLARADDFTTRERGQLCLGRLRAGGPEARVDSFGPDKARTERGALTSPTHAP
jgi:hypothetical protein